MNQSSGLDKLRNIALYFTMTAGILAGITWLISLMMENETINSLMMIFIIATAVGGVIMGLLYLAFILTRKK